MDKSSIHFAKGVYGEDREAVKLSLDVQNEAHTEKYLGMPTDIGTSSNGALFQLSKRQGVEEAAGMVGADLVHRRQGSLNQICGTTLWHVSVCRKDYVITLKQGGEEENELGHVGRHGQAEVLWWPWFQGYRAFQPGTTCSPSLAADARSINA
ncbi:hypothetical protein PR202_ga15801 [Eleusine coracana subsp. coracana]|uniref:Uncharacterized protein n=1 Tax=Eleusine coracana subsp. coracana TaxID=191504 RepID=A0AAV5CL63_ELECO|nr:hypothetical protein PR202_ga15801 [Eleusine coracana subsp. coracana]